MLRDKNLVPLSRQHQHALALCVRIDRASPIGDFDLAAWQGEIAQHFQTEIAIHFVAEERILFPAARGFHELNALVEELLADHAWLRERFAAAEARRMSAQEISAFGKRLSEHIRTEERQLFERLQELLSTEEFAAVGLKLEEALKGAGQGCMLPAETTRLRSAKS